MMAIQPTYVTFEQAKKFKEKGFDEYTTFLYCTEYSPYFGGQYGKTYLINRDKLREPSWLDYKYIIAPEQWLVVEWLRVNHNIWITIRFDACDTGYYDVHISVRGDRKIDYRPPYYYETPQEAYSEAFDYILNNLI